MNIKLPYTSRTLCYALLLIIIVLTSYRVILTYDVFNTTYDERAHTVTGLEWLERHTYRFEELHPPLSRIFIALPLYLTNNGLSDEALNSECPETFAEFYYRIKTSQEIGGFRPRCLMLADRQFFRGADYEELLSLARFGNIFFLIVLLLYVYKTGALLYDRKVGLTAAALTGGMPVLIGHAGLATTDFSVVATLIMVFFHSITWFHTKTWLNSFLLGGAIALCLLSKFSSLMFLPVVLLLSWGILLYQQRDKGQYKVTLRLILHLVTVGITVFFVMWAMYFFSLGTPKETFPFLARPSIESYMGSWLDIPIIPMPEYFIGVVTSYLKNAKGHAWYLLGKELHQQGVWYFFPVVLFFKTPLSFWVLLLISTVSGYTRKIRAIEWLPLLIAGGLVSSTLSTNINIGVRHILAAYPFLILFVAGSMVTIFRNTASKLYKYFIALLVSLYFITGIAVHPDYFPYFNILAHHKPEAISVDSDLDWNQDLKRMADVAHQMNITELHTCGLWEMFVVDPALPYKEDCSFSPETGGWFAARTFFIYALDPITLQWLKNHKPVKRVGRSILLYYFPPPR